MVLKDISGNVRLTLFETLCVDIMVEALVAVCFAGRHKLQLDAQSSETKLPSQAKIN